MEDLLHSLPVVRQPVLALVATVEAQTSAMELRLSAAAKSSHERLLLTVIDPQSSLAAAATRVLRSIEAASFASSATVVELAKAALENLREVAALEVVTVRAEDTSVD